MLRSSNENIVQALRILADEIQSMDGIANACIAEAADRIEELESLVTRSHSIAHDMRRLWMMEIGSLESEIADSFVETPVLNIETEYDSLKTVLQG